MTIARFLPYRFELCGCNRCLNAHLRKRPLYVVRVIKNNRGKDSKVYVKGHHATVISANCYEVYNAIVENICDVVVGLPNTIDTIDVQYPERN